MKFIIVLSVILALALSEQVSAKEHIEEWGKQEAGDKLIFSTIFSSRNGEDVATREVEFETDKKIDHVKVTDLNAEKHWGTVELVQGSIGENYIHIHLESQKNASFTFLVQMWGI